MKFHEKKSITHTFLCYDELLIVLTINLFTDKQIKLEEIFYKVKYNQIISRIQLNIENADKVFICSDKTRLLQVLLNLLSNAFKFTFQGSIVLLVDQEFHSIRQLLRFSVRDTGIGITQEQLQKLFGFFTTFDKKKGYGLGLAFAQRIVASLGPSQHIEVQSTKNKGSCFSFTIFQNLSGHRRHTALLREPLQQSGTCSPDCSPFNKYGFSSVINFLQDNIKENEHEDNEVFSSSNESQLDIQDVKSTPIKFLELFEKIPQQNITQKRSKILLVDDEAFNHVAFTGVIKRCFTDLQIDSAFNGAEAIQCLMQSAQDEAEEEQKYLCVVTDQQMPVMKGTELCQVLGNKIAEGHIYDLPVIISSANNSERDQTLYKEAGAVGFLDKPVQRDKLFQLISQVRMRSNNPRSLISSDN